MPLAAPTELLCCMGTCSGPQLDTALLHVVFMPAVPVKNGHVC